MKTTVSLALFAMVCMLFSCGTKDPAEIGISFDTGGSNPFARQDLADIIFCVDDAGQEVVFPKPDASNSSCAVSNINSCRDFPANCGFLPSSTEFRLKLDTVSIGASVTLEVLGRASAGTVIFEGKSASFANSKDTGSVAITVTEN